MTVSTSYAPLSFNGDDATTAFAVTWPFFDSSLVVTLVDSTGVETVKTITTHYTVSGGTDSDGLPATGTVTMLTAPASGETLRITRNTTKTQSSTWTNGGSYQAKTLEASLDRSMLIAQENAAAASDALDGITGDVMRLDSSGMTDYWDAEDQIIRNVADGTADDDAVNVSQLNAAAMGSYGSVVRAVDTIAALKAFDQTVATRVYLTDANRKGLFVWRSGDYSTEVTNDTQSGIYVKQDDTATTSGAWVREYAGPVNVRWFGAAADCVSLRDGVVSAGSTTLTSATASFTSADVGKVIQIDGASGVGSAPLSTTIASVTNATTVELSNAATVTTGQFTLTIPATATAGASGSYVPDDIVDIVGGTGTTTAQVRVVATKVRTIAVNAGGSTALGDGSYTIKGTTGTGNYFTATATVAGGTITGVTLASAGQYTTNPTSLSAEPITCTSGTITGATMTLTMDVNFASVETNGLYSVVPSNPISTTAGSVSGATGFTITGTWATTGWFLYGTDDATAFDAAMNYVIDEFGAGRRAALRVPSGEYLVNDTLPVFYNVPGVVIGDGIGATTIVVGSDFSGTLFAWSEAWIANSMPFAGVMRTDSHQKIGPTLIGMTLQASRHADATQNSIGLFDRCDLATLRDVYIQGFNGHALVMGERLNTIVAYTRESYVENIAAYNCGSASSAVFEITGYGSIGTNEIMFSSINIYGPNGYGMRIRGESGGTGGLLKFQSLRIEGLEYWANQVTGDLLLIGNPSEAAGVNSLTFDGLSLINPPKNYAALRLTAFNAATEPYFCVFNDVKISGGQCVGKGVVIERGRYNQINITNSQCANYDVEVQSTAGTANWIEVGELWDDFTTNIDSAVDDEVRLTTTTGADVTPTDNAIVRWDGTTGRRLQSSAVLITDAGAVSGITDLSMSGDITWEEDGAFPSLIIKRTDAHGNGQALFSQRIYGIDSGSAEQQFGSVSFFANNTTAGAETGSMTIGLPIAGTITTHVTIGFGLLSCAGGLLSTSATGGVGYTTGAGGTVTQDTSRTTGVTLNKVCGSITLVSAAGSTTPATFTVSNTAVAATDTIIVNQKSGTDLYNIHVTAVAAGSFNVTFWTTGGTTTEQPVFNFSVIKAVTA